MRFFRDTVGWGVSIYSIMFLVWSGLSIHGIETGYGALIFRLLVLFIVTLVAVQSLHLATRADLVPYAFAWAIVAAVLDFLLLVPIYSTALYSGYGVWIGYAVIVCVPFCVFEAMHLSRRGVAL